METGSSRRQDGRVAARAPRHRCRASLSAATHMLRKGNPITLPENRVSLLLLRRGVEG